MKAKDLDKIFDDGEVDINDYLDLSSANKTSKDTPDWQEGYEQGLLSGYTKSIVLIRHMQRTLSPTNVYSVSGYEILEEAMELISQNIKENNE